MVKHRLKAQSGGAAAHHSSEKGEPRTVELGRIKAGSGREWRSSEDGSPDPIDGSDRGITLSTRYCRGRLSRWVMPAQEMGAETAAQDQAGGRVRVNALGTAASVMLADDLGSGSALTLSEGTVVETAHHADNGEPVSVSLGSPLETIAAPSWRIPVRVYDRLSLALGNMRFNYRISRVRRLRRTGRGREADRTLLAMRATVVVCRRRVLRRV